MQPIWTFLLFEPRKIFQNLILNRQQNKNKALAKLSQGMLTLTGQAEWHGTKSEDGFAWRWSRRHNLPACLSLTRTIDQSAWKKRFSGSISEFNFVNSRCLFISVGCRCHNIAKCFPTPAPASASAPASAERRQRQRQQQGINLKLWMKFCERKRNVFSFHLLFLPIASVDRSTRRG